MYVWSYKFTLLTWAFLTIFWFLNKILKSWVLWPRWVKLYSKLLFLITSQSLFIHLNTWPIQYPLFPVISPITFSHFSHLHYAPIIFITSSLKNIISSLFIHTFHPCKHLQSIFHYSPITSPPLFSCHIPTTLSQLNTILISTIHLTSFHPSKLERKMKKNKRGEKKEWRKTTEEKFHLLLDYDHVW
jgi:hypothetical protein